MHTSTINAWAPKTLVELQAMANSIFQFAIEASEAPGLPNPRHIKVAVPSISLVRETHEDGTESFCITLAREPEPASTEADLG